MASLFDSNTTDSFDNATAVIKGATDNTSIGNIGDRLKVTSEITAVTGTPRYDASKLHYIDLNASVGGINREALISTTFVNLYSYTGSGGLHSFLLTLEDSKNAYVRIVVDGTHYPLFGTTGLFLDDCDKGNLYDMHDLSERGLTPLDLTYHDDTIILKTDYPIGFNTSITIQARRVADSKKFRAGFIRIIKD